MTEAKKKPPNAGKGRVAGVPNKVTSEAREAYRNLVEWAAPKMRGWLEKTAEGVKLRDADGNETNKYVVFPDPGRALDLVAKLSDFVLPRLGRIEHAGEVIHRHAKEMSDDQLLSIASGSSDRAADAPERSQEPPGVH